jgi:hypothetical protein
LGEPLADVRAAVRVFFDQQQPHVLNYSTRGALPP